MSKIRCTITYYCRDSRTSALFVLTAVRSATRFKSNQREILQLMWQDTGLRELVFIHNETGILRG